MFKDQVVWITGASAGIGRYLALEFAAQGAKLAISARREDKLAALQAELEKLGAPTLSVPCDVADDAQIEAAAAAIVKHFGKLDVAVANAGFGVYGAIERLHAEEWRRQFEVNVTGLAMTAKYALPHLRQSRGRLALIGSVSAYLPYPKTGAYAASKAAVRSIGMTLDMELAGSGVSCTTIHPGYVDSEIAQVDNEGVYRPERTDRRPKNLMWSTDQAARVMARAIYRRKRQYVFTGHGKLLAFVGQHLPSLARWLVARLG
jgi:NAD(P)-dependent dehydrogenase (short-subunit alcohol dehydrogenase family)